jgi:hypothetical protein
MVNRSLVTEDSRDDTKSSTIAIVEGTSGHMIKRWHLVNVVVSDECNFQILPNPKADTAFMCSDDIDRSLSG